ARRSALDRGRTRDPGRRRGGGASPGLSHGPGRGGGPVAPRTPPDDAPGQYARGLDYFRLPFGPERGDVSGHRRNAQADGGGVWTEGQRGPEPSGAGG